VYFRVAFRPAWRAYRVLRPSVLVEIRDYEPLAAPDHHGEKLVETIDLIGQGRHKGGGGPN
tara:strand:- start:358 stop:540 length:183 start_codon:yes stop_codon:yes gene_type:complete